MSTARVREARREDRAAIRELTLAAYTEYAALLPQAWKSYRANIVTTLARPGPARQLVAEQVGALVGAVMLYPASTSPRRSGAVPSPEVRLLAVAPSARGQGIGEALMRACIERARAGGDTALTLHTTAVMRAALRLYGRLGFERRRSWMSRWRRVSSSRAIVSILLGPAKAPTIRPEQERLPSVQERDRWPGRSARTSCAGCRRRRWQP